MASCDVSRQILDYVVLRQLSGNETLMAEELNKTLSDFIRVSDELLMDPRPSLTTHELDILEGDINELSERFFSPPNLA